VPFILNVNEHQDPRGAAMDDRARARTASSALELRHVAD